jgi:formylglycine-generating enzyme required for sulfatase activity
VPHASRWALPLPDAQRTRALLAAQLEATLALLHKLPPDADDAALYFFRLALLHEDMHHEAALYMARELGLALADTRWQPPPLPAPRAPLRVAGGLVAMGRAAAGPGFAFDNECGHCTETVPDFEIDAQPLRWDDFLPFVRDQGYTQARWWTDAGTRWLACQGGGAARARAVQQAARPGTAAMHLCQHEALAWCRWAGRRLPTEAEWLQAQRSQGAAFNWGQVWEWTASAFAPFEGFEPHPYREYSAPWFDGRPVLKGASCLTQPRLRHPDYRNFFPAGRCDIPAGWRSCRSG